jgi:hypothetical protein
MHDVRGPFFAGSLAARYFAQRNANVVLVEKADLHKVELSRAVCKQMRTCPWLLHGLVPLHVSARPCAHASHDALATQGSCIVLGCIPLMFSFSSLLFCFQDTMGFSVGPRSYNILLSRRWGGSLSSMPVACRAVCTYRQHTPCTAHASPQEDAHGISQSTRSSPRCKHELQPDALL